ncbi:ankyrin [Aspergillus japonicus CBS 114.51]|uniref:Ankyrin n=1 Tax=Aspergillus japonicus CBS 114.51 TaxID=1448312 RepID=A0A8T8WRB6_ASPJA|nr:ankyrin [Aspergillus japonicus CBS 114.51]RAH78395.1 ankyrin [Aspergillus japonicus CBS 114.51]
MRFINLPPELLLNIGEHLTQKKDVSALAQTNRHLQQVYEPLLYGRGKQDTATADLRLNISCCASAHGEVEALNKLVKFGAKFPTNESEAKELRWFTMKYHPVFMAARKGHLKIVKSFLDRGFEVECRDSKGCSLFHLAATHNHKRIVYELLARQANEFSSNNDGLTIFDLVDKINMSAVMPALIKDGWAFGLDPPLAYKLCRAVNWEICELLCNYGAIPHGSLPHGSLPHPGVICEEDGYETKENYPFVIQTVYHGHRAFHDIWDISDRCFEFLNFGHDKSFFITAVGFNTLLCAAYHGDGEIAQKFLDRFPELERSIPDAMIIAAFSHRNDTMSYFLSKGADPDYTLDEAVTALSHAGYHGWVDQVQLLLSAGASITLKDAAGKTPIWYAVQARRREVLALYREHSPADFDAYKNKMGLKREKITNVQDAAYCKTCSSWWKDKLNICMWWEYAQTADAVARAHIGQRTGVHEFQIMSG